VGFFLNFLITGLTGLNVLNYQICILTKVPQYYCFYMQTGVMLFIRIDACYVLCFQCGKPNLYIFCLFSAVH
jgi:hypothetical protein